MSNKDLIEKVNRVIGQAINCRGRYSEPYFDEEEQELLSDTAFYLECALRAARLGKEDEAVDNLREFMEKYE